MLAEAEPFAPHGVVRRLIIERADEHGVDIQVFERGALQPEIIGKHVRDKELQRIARAGIRIDGAVFRLRAEHGHLVVRRVHNAAPAELRAPAHLDGERAVRTEVDLKGAPVVDMRNALHGEVHLDAAVDIDISVGIHPVVVALVDVENDIQPLFAVGGRHSHFRRPEPVALALGEFEPRPALLVVDRLVEHAVDGHALVALCRGRIGICEGIIVVVERRLRPAAGGDPACAGGKHTRKGADHDLSCNVFHNYPLFKLISRGS